MTKPIAFYDCEVFSNFFFVCFNMDGVNYVYRQLDNAPIDRNAIAWFLQNTTLVGFNNKKYDDIMLLLVVYGASNYDMYYVSQQIIVEQISIWSVIKQQGLDERTNNIPFIYNDIDSIDLIDVLVGKAGLKLYGSRIHFHRLQELPVAFDKDTTYEDQLALEDYCINSDVPATMSLYDNQKKGIDLRIDMGENYGVDLRSKSGPQIAETLLVKMCEEASGNKIYKPRIGKEVPLSMKYKKPAWIYFKTAKYQQLLAEIEADTFNLNEETGHLILGKSVQDRIVQSNDCSIKLGIGGAHAITMPGARFSTDDWVIIESDFASLYPNMIVNSGSYPAHFGESFFTTYRDILASRLEDKHAGRITESNAKKLILNASFGQFSSKYSRLYSPDLLLNTTLSGQLTLLMLIEQLELNGFNIFTCNTDSVTVGIQRKFVDLYKGLCTDFEKQTNLTLEHDEYKSYVTSNVNNYFAIYTNNKIKRKGMFQSSHNDVQHNPSGNVITDAVVNCYAENMMVEEYITRNNDMRDFVYVQTVKGGAKFKDEFVGKIVRFYFSKTSEDALHYVKTDNKVPLSDRSRPMMDFKEGIPSDLDLQRYIDVSNELFNTISVTCKAGKNKQVFKYMDMGLSIVPYPHKGVALVKAGYDFSATPMIGVQTGYRANTIGIRCNVKGVHHDEMLFPPTLVMNEWSFYRFEDMRYPGAMTAISKKIGYEIKYGGSLLLTHYPVGTISELSESMQNMIFNNMTKSQRLKAVFND